MDTILYFSRSETETMHFLKELSGWLHLYGIPCTINYRDMTAETANYKIYAVSSCDALIGALPGIKYYLNDTTREEFDKRVKFKLLEGAKQLESFVDLIEFLRMSFF